MKGRKTVAVDPIYAKYADFKPLPVDGPARAFGAMGAELKRLVPMYFNAWRHEYEVPDAIRESRDSLWCVVVSQWFFGGLREQDEFVPKPGIDGKAALAHVMAVLRSFEPDHNGKERVCAFLLSLWFDDYVPSDEHSDHFRRKIGRAKHGGAA